jgi:CBS domain containing-hemolysin-like protein
VVNWGALSLAIAASALAALCASADGALLSSAVEPARSDPRLSALLQRRERVHRALAFARAIGHLVAGTAFAVAIGLAAAGASGELTLLRFIGAAFAGVLVILVSESVARSAGDALGPSAALRLVVPVQVLERVLSPVVALGAWIDRSLHTLLPAPPLDDDDQEMAAEQFRRIVTAEAEVSREDELLLRGVFAMADTEVKDVMVPRVAIVGIDRDAPWSELVDRIRSAEHSRLPVYVDTIDNVVGVIYAKDLLLAVASDAEPDAGWQSMVRHAEFIPATMPIDRQLRAFQASHTHMAIVADEFGGTAGLVTIEDILEEIVGEIRDEYDVEEAPIEQEDGNKFWVNGGVTLEELSEVLGTDFERDGVTSVGGLLFELLGRVPRAGEAITLQGYRVVIERVKRRRIDRVYFERPEADFPAQERLS